MRKGGLANVNKEFRAYCGSLALVSSCGISLYMEEQQLVKLCVEDVLVLGGASLQLQEFT